MTIFTDDPGSASFHIIFLLYLIYSTPCLKKVYHPTANDSFNSSCPIPVIFVEILLSEYAIKGSLISHLTYLAHMYIPYPWKFYDPEENHEISLKLHIPQCWKLNTKLTNSTILLCWIALFLVAPLACCEARLNQSGCRVCV